MPIAFASTLMTSRIESFKTENSLLSVVEGGPAGSTRTFSTAAFMLFFLEYSAANSSANDTHSSMEYSGRSLMSKNTFSTSGMIFMLPSSFSHLVGSNVEIS